MTVSLEYTTGAYLLAKSNAHARTLFQQFRDHSLRKTYIAVVRGGRESFPEAGYGTINTRLGKKGEKMAVDEDEGNLALTDWELLGSSVRSFWTLMSYHRLTPKLCIRIGHRCLLSACHFIPA